MKYNIMGFYQPRAVELGLDSNDLLVLRWFVDYRDTNKMRQIVINNKVFYWVNYATVLEELPVLKVSKQTLARRYFGNLVRANVLEHERVTEGGCFSYYCYGLNYDTLVYLSGGCVKNDDPMLKNTEGCVKNYTGGVLKITEQINNIYNTKQDNNILYRERIERETPSPSKEEIAKDLIMYLTSKTDIEYDMYEAIQLVAMCLEYATPDEIKQVIDCKCEEWLGDKKMVAYLRPSTLFGNKFKSYLKQAKVETLNKNTTVLHNREKSDYADADMLANFNDIDI